MESTPQSVASVPAQRLRTLLWTRPWLSGACCVQRPVPDTSASGPVHHGADVTPQGPAASASPFWASSCPERLLLSPSGTADASGLAPTPSVNGGGGGGGGVLQAAWASSAASFHLRTDSASLDQGGGSDAEPRPLCESPELFYNYRLCDY